MLKKILIGLLIVLILAGSGALYAYKKLESQFESFIFAEVERKQAAAEKVLDEKISAAALEAEKAMELAEVKLNEERSAAVIKTYFDDIRSEYPEGKEVYIESLIPSASVENTVEETDDTKKEDTQVSSNNSSSDSSNAASDSSSASSTEVTTSNTTSSVAESNETREEVVAVETASEQTAAEESSEEVYTKEDFERDKKIAMDLAMSRLTASQISRLIDISSGGFSPEEKVEAKEMFYSNFSAEEQEWIMDIYTKYYFLVSEE